MTTVTHPAGLDLTSMYRQHRLTLLRMAVLLVHDRATAEDVVQDAFVSFHRSRDRLRDPEAALGYLRTCVVNAEPVRPSAPGAALIEVEPWGSHPY